MCKLLLLKKRLRETLDWNKVSFVVYYKVFRSILKIFADVFIQTTPWIFLKNECTLKMNA